MLPGFAKSAPATCSIKLGDETLAPMPARCHDRLQFHAWACSVAVFAHPVGRMHCTDFCTCISCDVLETEHTWAICPEYVLRPCAELGRCVQGQHCEGTATGKDLSGSLFQCSIISLQLYLVDGVLLLFVGHLLLGHSLRPQFWCSQHRGNALQTS